MTSLSVTERGDRFWYNEQNQLHKEDGPAMELMNGDKEWFMNGKHHREGGPAIEYANGGKMWLKNGRYHREDGPAVDLADGRKSWYKDGVKEE